MKGLLSVIACLLISQLTLARQLVLDKKGWLVSMDNVDSKTSTNGYDWQPARFPKVIGKTVYQTTGNPFDDKPERPACIPKKAYLNCCSGQWVSTTANMQ